MVCYGISGVVNCKLHFVSSFFFLFCFFSIFFFNSILGNYLPLCNLNCASASASVIVIVIIIIVHILNSFSWSDAQDSHTHYRREKTPVLLPVYF